MCDIGITIILIGAVLSFMHQMLFKILSFNK